MNTSSVIEKFKEVHGGKYDYSLVNYVTAHCKVQIICEIHGLFEQTPNSHRKNRGCPKCVGRGLTTNEIVCEFEKVHGKRYDYSLVKYISALRKVKIKCRIHGTFLQTSVAHRNNQGCPTCGKTSSEMSRRLSQDRMLGMFKDVHGITYDYSKVVYTTSKVKVDIICKIHGVFTQTPSNHKRGVGCPKCNKISDNDVLYVWEAVGERWNDKPIFKIGVTSKRLGMTRVKQVAYSMGFEYKIHLLEVVDKARSKEQEILNKLYDIPTLIGNGSTEFRACSYQELEKLKEALGL